MAGISALAAAISWAGTVLSQPPIITTASIGWARTISSVSMAMRLRRNMEVGFEKLSWIEMVGNSIGRPPAKHDTALHRLDQARHVAVAGVEIGKRVGDADDRAIERIIGETRRLDEGLAQEKREPCIAVARQPLAQPGCRCLLLIVARHRQSSLPGLRDDGGKPQRPRPPHSPPRMML